MVAFVKSHVRRSPRGTLFKVSAHSRTTRKRGDYNIPQARQHPARAQNNLMLDAEIKALKPGKRKSANRRIYYERRFNRSDKGMNI